MLKVAELLHDLVHVGLQLETEFVAALLNGQLGLIDELVALVDVQGVVVGIVFDFPQLLAQPVSGHLKFLVNLLIHLAIELELAIQLVLHELHRQIEALDVCDDLHDHLGRLLKVLELAVLEELELVEALFEELLLLQLDGPSLSVRNALENEDLLWVNSAAYLAFVKASA